MAKRRKSTRRRSTRRRRSLGAVPVYPPTLLATGMPAPALTVGPMLGSPPDEHSRRAEMLEQSMKDQLAHGETLAIRGDCELALYKLWGLDSLPTRTRSTSRLVSCATALPAVSSKRTSNKEGSDGAGI